MITLIKRTFLLLFITVLVVLTGLGCRTANGFGQDLEKAGEGIQNGTKK